MDQHTRGLQLIDLPMDIKSLIYQWLFVDWAVKLRAVPPHMRPPYDDSLPERLSILSCCKQIREEALPYFYAYASFYLEQTYLGHRPYAPVPQNLHHVRKARLSSLSSAVELAVPALCRKLGRATFDFKWLEFRKAYPAIRELHFITSLPPGSSNGFKKIYNNEESIKVTLTVSCPSVKPKDARIFTNGLHIEFILQPNRTLLLKHKFFSKSKGRAREEWVACLDMVLQELDLSHSQVRIIET